MIDEAALLVEGERRLGHYTVVILQQTSDGTWSPSVLSMDGLITNYRLMLRPHRKKYTPASLPAHYIKGVDMVVKGRHHCVQLTLITNHILCLVLSTGKLTDLLDDLNAMKSPAPRFQFDDKVARQDIERLITFFGREPLPNNPN